MTSIQKTHLGMQMHALRGKLSEAKHAYDSAQGRYKACEKETISKHGYACFDFFPELRQRHEEVLKARQKIYGIYREMRKVTTQKKQISSERRKVVKQTVQAASLSKKMAGVLLLKAFVERSWTDALTDLPATPYDAYVSPLICDAKKRLHIWLEYADCAPEQFKAVSRTIHEKMHADIADWKQMAGLRF